MSDKIRKEKEENKEKDNWLRRYLHSIIQDWDIKVMTYVMVVVTAVALISGTVAWFVYYPRISAQNLGIMTASSDNLKVAINLGGADIEEIKSIAESAGLVKDNIVFSLNMPIYDDVEYYETTQYMVTESETYNPITPEEPVKSVEIEEKRQVKVNKLAPGVSGEIVLYLTPLSREVNQYRITPSVLLNYIDGEEDHLDEASWQIQKPSDTANISEETRTILRKLIQGHILFFETRETQIDSEGNVTYIYSNQIFPDRNSPYEVGPLEGTLNYNTIACKGEEKKVSIYWCWPYEYENIPEETKQKIKVNHNIAGTKVFENSMFFYTEDVENLEQLSTTTTEEGKTQFYDYADTYIGQFVESMRFYFKIEGYHVQDTSQNTVTTSSQPMP